MARFNRWWGKTWQATPRAKALKKLMQINIKSYKTNRQLRLSRSFNLKRLLTPQVKLPLPKWTRAPLEQEHPPWTILAKIKKLTREQKPLPPTGELASSTMTTMRISTTLSRTTSMSLDHSPINSWVPSWTSKKRFSASMPLADKERRAKAEVWLSMTTQKRDNQSWVMKNQLLMICELNEWRYLKIDKSMK